MENVFPMPLFIYFEDTIIYLEADFLFSSFTDPEMERKFFSQMGHMQSFNPTLPRLLQRHLVFFLADIYILDLKLRLEWVKTFGDVEMQSMYFSCKKDMNWLGTRSGGQDC